MNNNEQKVTMSTTYMYAGPRLEWYSSEHYETQEAAKDAAEASIMNQKKMGYNVVPIIVIVQEDTIRIYDDLTVIREDRHRVVVEKIQTILMNM